MLLYKRRSRLTATLPLSDIDHLAHVKHVSKPWLVAVGIAIAKQLVRRVLLLRDWGGCWVCFEDVTCGASDAGGIWRWVHIT
jgi:hypothetical protein